MPAPESNICLILALGGFSRSDASARLSRVSQLYLANVKILHGCSIFGNASRSDSPRSSAELRFTERRTLPCHRPSTRSATEKQRHDRNTKDAIRKSRKPQIQVSRRRRLPVAAAINSVLIPALMPVTCKSKFYGASHLRMRPVST